MHYNKKSAFFIETLPEHFSVLFYFFYFFTACGFVQYSRLSWTRGPMGIGSVSNKQDKSVRPPLLIDLIYLIDFVIGGILFPINAFNSSANFLERL
jgi:hypothetical protein